MHEGLSRIGHEAESTRPMMLKTAAVGQVALGAVRRLIQRIEATILDENELLPIFNQTVTPKTRGQDCCPII